MFLCPLTCPNTPVKKRSSARTCPAQPSLGTLPAGFLSFLWITLRPVWSCLWHLLSSRFLFRSLHHDPTTLPIIVLVWGSVLLYILFYLPNCFEQFTPPKCILMSWVGHVSGLSGRFWLFFYFIFCLFFSPSSPRTCSWVCPLPCCSQKPLCVCRPLVSPSQAALVAGGGPLL